MRPDLLCIATPPAAHLEAVRAAAERGVHVICEKPLAADTAQAWEMLALAQGAGIVHATDFQFRYWPGRARFRDLVREGVLGELRLLRYVWTAPMRLDPAAPPPRLVRAGGDGRGRAVQPRLPLLRLRALVLRRGAPPPRGRCTPSWPSAPCRTGRMARVTTDDTASTELRLAGGALVSAQFGFVTAGRRISIEAYGAEGTLILEDDLQLTVVRGPVGAPQAVPVPPADPPEPKPLAPFVAPRPRRHRPHRRPRGGHNRRRDCAAHLRRRGPHAGDPGRRAPGGA